MLPLIAENAQPRSARRAVPSTIEDSGKITGRPSAVDEDGMWRVDSFEPVVQRAGAWPHLGKHGVAVQRRLAVHRLEQPPAQSAGRDNGCASGRQRARSVIACHVFSEDPVGAVGIEEWVEGYEVRLLANAPDVIIVFVRPGDCWRFGEIDFVVEWCFGAPDWLLRFCGFGGGDTWIVGKVLRPCICFVVCAMLCLHAHHVREIIPRAMLSWDIETGITFP